MRSISGMTADPVDELRLRRWARENYAPFEERDRSWHPIVIDEMHRKDRELMDADRYEEEIGRRIVPLVPDVGWTLHGPHIETTRAAVLMQIPVVTDAPQRADSR